MWIDKLLFVQVARLNELVKLKEQVCIWTEIISFIVDFISFCLLLHIVEASWNYCFFLFFHIGTRSFQDDYWTVNRLLTSIFEVNWFCFIFTLYFRSSYFSLLYWRDIQLQRANSTIGYDRARVLYGNIRQTCQICKI